MMNKMMKKTILNRMLLGGSVLLVLAGCSATEDSTTNTTTTTTTTTSTGVTLSGTVAKGIVWNGVITAYELKADGGYLASVGVATTDQTGAYSLDLQDNYKGGPIKILTTPDTKTLMKCDASVGCGTYSGTINSETPNNGDTNIDFGEWYAPSSLSIQAIIPEAANGETISVHITPFTHMAAELALETGTIDASVVARANSAVSEMLGVDIINTEPVDVTDSSVFSDADISDSPLAYSTFNAAVANLEQSNTSDIDGDGNVDLADTLAMLANTIETTTDAEGNTNFTITATDDDSDATILSLQDITEEAALVVTKINETEELSIATTTLIAALEQTAANADADGYVTVTASDTSTRDNIDQVKAMVADVRLWGDVINTDMMAAEAANATLSAQVDAAGRTVDFVMENRLNNLLGWSTEATIKYVMAEPGAGDLAAFTTESEETYTCAVDTVCEAPTITPFTSGTVTGSETADGLTVTITDGLYEWTDYTGATRQSTVNLSITIPRPSVTTPAIAINSWSVSDPAVDFSASGSATLTLPTAYTIDWDALYNGTATEPLMPTDITLALDASITAKVNLDDLIDSYEQVTTTLPEGWAPTVFEEPVAFSGAIDVAFNSAEWQLNEVVWATPSILEFDGSVSTIDTTTNTAIDSMALNIVAHVTNSDSFEAVLYEQDSLYSTNHDNTMPVTWSYTDTDGDKTDDTFSITAPGFSATITTGAAAGEYIVSQAWDDRDVPYSWSYYGDSLNEAVINNTAILPHEYWTEDGTYALGALPDLTVAGETDLILVSPEINVDRDTINGWLDADFGITFTADLPGLPEARFNINGDRDGFRTGSFDMTITYGTRNLNIAVNTDVTGIDDGTIVLSDVFPAFTITNQDAVEMVITPTWDATGQQAISGSIKMNGIIYGVITTTDTGLVRIDYTDGYSEIF